jgi:hypothetical protein
MLHRAGQFGDGVDWWVGCSRLGFGVGSAVGFAVGFAVGSGVGFGVGSAVSSSGAVSSVVSSSDVASSVVSPSGVRLPLLSISPSPSSGTTGSSPPDLHCSKITSHSAFVFTGEKTLATKEPPMFGVVEPNLSPPLY